MENSIVEDWLRSLQLYEYSESFIDNGYDDLEICKKIDEPDLDAIGVVNAVHRDRILNAVKILLEQGGTAVYFTLEEASKKPADENEKAASPSSSIGTSASISSTETRRTSDSGGGGDAVADSNASTITATSLDYRHNIVTTQPINYRDQSANLVKIPRLQLKMLIRDRLVSDGIKLSSSPYTNPDGSTGFLEGLASRYAEQLRTHYQDVLERLGELWTKMVPVELNRLSQVMDAKCCDNSLGSSIYTPGIYSPSSCLSDQDEELIYGYTKLPNWCRNKVRSSPRSFPSRSPNMYDSDGYYSIGFSDKEPPANSIKKKSGIGKFFKVLSSKRDKNSSKNSNKSQRQHLNNVPLVDRGNTSLYDRNDSYRLKSPIDDERLRIMLLASEGKISVKCAIERVKMIEADRKNNVQQENVEVLSNFRKSVEKIPGTSCGHQDPLNYTNDSSLRKSHFYDDPPYESEDSDFAKSNDKSRRKFRSKKVRHRQCSSPKIERDKSSASMNGTSHYRERSLSSDEFRSHILSKGRSKAGQRLITYSTPNTPVHYSAASAREFAKLSTSCTQSPAYGRNHTTNHQSKCSDCTDSPATSRRQRLGMLTRIKQLASRNSLSADEEVGHSPSEYDEKEEIEMARIDYANPRDLNGRPNTIVGKMKVLRRDVKRKISKLRSSRGSESEVRHSEYVLLSLKQTDAALSSMVMSHGSSVESLDDTQESILSTQVLTTTTTTASSSNRSSASTDCDSNIGWNFPVIARAQALVNCIPSPYDHDALKFKKGQIIDVISMDRSGIWKGICGNQIGTFKFINVKIMENEHRSHRNRHHNRKRYSKKSKPKCVDELLQRINLEQYISVFTLNGYENLELFQDVEEDDLDYLGIVEPEHRAKIITAAELLHDHCESPDRDAGKTDKSNFQTVGNNPPTMENSVSFDTVFKCKQSPYDSGCFASNENVHKKENVEKLPPAGDSETSQSESGIHSSEGVDAVILSSLNNLDMTVNSSDADKQNQETNSGPMNVGWQDIASENSDKTKETRPVKPKKAPPPIPSRANVPANLDQLKRPGISKHNEPPSQAPIHSPMPAIDHQTWLEDTSSNNFFSSSPKSNSQGRNSNRKKGHNMELNLSKKSPRNHGGVGSKNSRVSNMEVICNPALMNLIVQKLNAEGIILSEVPYTDRTGFCGIPPALVQRYSEELDKDLSVMATTLDRIRIIQLKMQGRIGVPNDFLIDSCSNTIIEAKYESVCDWLISIGMPMYYESFNQMGFMDLEQCSRMTEKELKVCKVLDDRHLQKFLCCTDSLRMHICSAE